MSSTETSVEPADESPGVLTRAYRTVTPSYQGKEDAAMDSFGWAMFLGVVVLLVPLLPFLLIVWVGTKLLDAVRGRRASED